MKTINKLENGRAAFAYKCAEEGKAIYKPDERKNENQIDGIYYKDDKYKSYVKNIPMLIKTNGLGATLAFINSKGVKKIKNGKNPGEKENPKNAYDLVYHQLTEWFKKEENPMSFKVEELVKDLCEMDSQQYRAMTKETLAFFNWLRRFAEGLIEGDE